MARSRAYPVSSLEDAVKDLRTLDQELGRGRHDRNTLAQAIGYKAGSGLAARRIAALVQYGLVDRYKDEYAFSALADPMLHPVGGEQGEALRRAFFNVSLFAEVVNQYQEGGRLPRQLATLLYRQHRITSAAKDEVAEILRASACFAGIVDEEGRFLDQAAARPSGYETHSNGSDDRPSDPPPPSDPSRLPATDPSPPLGITVSTASQLQRVPLTHGWAEISLPATLTARDLKKLRKLIEFVAVDVDEEAEV